ncbi:MAG: FkbM family methyltransferase, partial [Fulvivirga sp.]
CFEANPDNFKKLCENIVDTSKISAIHKIVCDKVDIINLNVYEKRDNKGLSSIKNRISHKSAKTYPVESVRLDHFFSELKKSDNVALWIDVEGATYDVLVGAELIFSNLWLIHCEVENRPMFSNSALRSEIKQFFKIKGFREICYSPHITEQGISSIGDSLFINENMLSMRDWMTIILPLLKEKYDLLKGRVFRFLKLNLPFLIRIWEWLKREKF